MITKVTLPKKGAVCRHLGDQTKYECRAVVDKRVFVLKYWRARHQCWEYITAYAMDFEFETPLYTVEKQPKAKKRKTANKQLKDYAAMSKNGHWETKKALENLKTFAAGVAALKKAKALKTL